MPVRNLALGLALRGAAAVIFGIVALFWPGVTVIALAFLFGIYAIVDGVGSFVGAYRHRGDGIHRAALIVMGLAGIAAGIVAFVWPGITAAVLAILVGAWAVVIGVIDVWAAIRFRREMRREWLLALVGALSIVAGVFILARPTAGAVAIAQVIGVFALVAGIFTLVEAWRLSRFASHIRNPTPGGAHPAHG